LYKKYGIDVDGLLAIFDQGFSDVLIKTSGRDLFPTKPYSPPCWDWTAPLGYTVEESKAAWNAVMEDPSFWRSLPAYPETKRILMRLGELETQGHEVYFITHRMGVRPKEQTAQWLLRHGYPAIPSVIVSGKKGPIAQGLALDVFIDDKPSNCEDVLHALGTSGSVYLLDRSWNQEYANKYVPRVKTVMEIL
jgi:5'(3')-deoxyribonucleotidase